VTDFGSLQLTRDGEVATIALRSLRSVLGAAKGQPGYHGDPHTDLGRALLQLRDDPGVRIIIITGEQDGDFLSAPPSSIYDTAGGRNRLVDPDGAWNVFMNGNFSHQLMLEIEKPIIARVNGDAVGYGQSIMLCCDLILAREDARIADLHRSMGEVSDREGNGLAAKFGMVPGDGGGSMIPLFMTPTRAKEYMFLARVLTAAELAEIGVVNRAVPMEQLDAVVEEYVTALLRRPAHALGWTKRVLNRGIVTHYNYTADPCAAYEMITFLQNELAARDAAARGQSAGKPAAGPA
jgi:enoyl-CoA hydratase